MNRREAIQRTGMVLGYAVSAPTIMAMLNGCETKPGVAFKPVWLSEDQARLISEVTEIIIPRTDTPGAKDVGVPGFIDQVMKECYKKEDQDKFLNGLTAFDDGAKELYGDAFNDLDTEQQVAYVKKIHDEAISAKRAATTKENPFILVVKELTLVGFFSSEPGATQVLQYQAVPGAYNGCVPLAEVGKTWAS